MQNYNRKIYYYGALQPSHGSGVMDEIKAQVISYRK